MSSLDKDFEAIKPTIKTAALEFKQLEATANERNDDVALYRAERDRNALLQELGEKFGFSTVWHEFLEYYYE